MAGEEQLGLRCHLLWGDICGYIWGKTSERIEVPVVNDRQLENQVRKHMDGANHAERRGLYETVWANKK